MLHGELYRYFCNDHARLDRLLTRAGSSAHNIDVEAFTEFRNGILRHIWQEERLLLPAVQKGQRGEPFDHAERLRLDHGAIAALLVPPPSAETLAVLRHILTRHNPVEEGPDGLYELCEKFTEEDAAAFMLEVLAAPDIPTLPSNDDPDVLPAIKRAVARAGYDFDSIARPA